MNAIRSIAPEEGRQLPQAVELEQAVLGAIMLEASAMVRVAEIIDASAFHVEAHRSIYGACEYLHRQGHPIELLTVCDELRRRGELEQVGGAFYVAGLTGKMASSANVEYHARIVLERRIARRIIEIGSSASEQGYATDDSLELLDRVSGQITDLYASLQPNQMPSAADGIGDLVDASPSRHYTFGVSKLDEMAVFQCGLPHVFAGRPGIGKSVFAVHVMWHLTQLGNVLLFSPEMTLRQVQARILSNETGVPYSAILRKRMDEQQLDTVAAKSMQLAERLTRLKVDPTGGITPQQMRARCERAMKAHGIIAFGVDHLHEMSSGDPKVDRSEFDRVSACMTGITDIAKSTMLPALVMCQLNRAVEGRGDKRPNMADLRGSGKIEEKGVVVGLLFREGYYMPEPPYVDTLEFNIAKNRDGSVGVCHAEMIPSLSRITDALPGRQVSVPINHPTSPANEPSDAPF